MTSALQHSLLEFIRLNQAAPRVFGFPEFLAALALMILAWTNADTRYRFRVRVAPLNLTLTTFVVVALLGVLTLATDVWRAAEWRVPKGSALTPVTWQMLLGAAFLATFLIWAWFALIRPPVFRKRNAARFGRVVARSLMRGEPGEIAIIADELLNSANNLVRLAPNEKRFGVDPSEKREPLPRHALIAADVFAMLADRRFCRVIVEQCPSTALAIFTTMKQTRRFDIPIEIFAKNLVAEAISNPKSFLYHEADWYDSGFLGEHQPLTQAMFSDAVMVERVGTLLNAEYPESLQWETDHWAAYCRITSITWRDFAKTYRGNHSASLYGAIQNIKNLTSELYGGTPDKYDEATKRTFQLIRLSAEFLVNATDALNDAARKSKPELRVRDQNLTTFYDYLADAMFHVIFHVSNIKAHKWRWEIQHNATWSNFFNVAQLEGAAGVVVKHKLRRLIYNEVKKMTAMPNFVGGPILGMCLNVLGLTLRRSDYSAGTFALHKAVLSWTRQNFAGLYVGSPQVAESCLATGGLQYNVTTRLLSKTTHVRVHRDPRVESIVVDPA